MSAYRKDKDKLKRISAVCSAHTLTCKQTLELVKLTKGCNTDVAVVCYGSLADKESFKKEVVSTFQWEEEKTEIAEKIKKKYGVTI
eukprot:CAMPEP_0167773814 /NCGR_PEP_ID=MMETSP0111_2-20121227/1646_1 /TAXON_ID=91324 /ORGANISM="Lotharella globosa, Strain CCCM811" /LENGTH=85 /DNA_ID=CAMNT_0007663527 /DNA_START=125 /DNA_END=382 /DNA_ORIENTATION=-